MLELLFSERNHVCSVCVSNGHCELQILAQTLGMDHVHLPYRYPRLPVDASHDRFVHRPQSLHSVHALRAGVRRDRRRAHLGRDGARRQRRVITDLNQPWGESKAARLRQVRAGLPDRRALREGHDRWPRCRNDASSCPT